jgi:hypothetical protein
LSIVYAVRCNFSRADLEPEWNDWYDGPKTEEMLSKPGFLSGQRYSVAGLDQTIRYLALWVLESPEALNSPAYKSSWGFFDWTPYIVDWSRNLYRTPDGDVSPMLDVPSGGGLHFVACDGVPATQAKDRVRELAVRHPSLTWMPVVGLDRSCGVIGFCLLPDAGRLPLPVLGGTPGVRESLYRPIAARRRAV